MNQRTNALPRVLLAEDDPVSAAFLREAIAGFPAIVDVAATVAEARLLAVAQRYDLLLFDAHLPDGTGGALLAALRDRGVDTPAVAHTAERDDRLRGELLARGFVDVLPKPLGVAALQAALAGHLPRPAQVDWDDAAALSAVGGEAAHVTALRSLFLSELPAQVARIRAAHAEGATEAMRAELHRLTASCGFVGAPRVAAAVMRLQCAPLDPNALDDLQQATDAVLATSRG